MACIAEIWNYISDLTNNFCFLFLKNGRIHQIHATSLIAWAILVRHHWKVIYLIKSFHENFLLYHDGYQSTRLLIWSSIKLLLEHVKLWKIDNLNSKVKLPYKEFTKEKNNYKYLPKKLIKTSKFFKLKCHKFCIKIATFYSTQRNLGKIKTKKFRQIEKVIANFIDARHRR